MSMQKKMVVLPQNSSLKLNVPFKMVHHSLGFLYAHLGLHLVCAVNRVSSTVWWNFVQILRYIIALFLWISRKKSQSHYLYVWRVVRKCCLPAKRYLFQYLSWLLCRADCLIPILKIKLTKSAIYSSNRGVQFKPFY